MGLVTGAYYREEGKLAVHDAPVIEALNAVIAKHGRWEFLKYYNRLWLDGSSVGSQASLTDLLPDEIEFSPGEPGSA